MWNDSSEVLFETFDDFVRSLWNTFPDLQTKADVQEEMVLATRAKDEGLSEFGHRAWLQSEQMQRTGAVGGATRAKADRQPRFRFNGGQQANQTVSVEDGSLRQRRREMVCYNSTISRPTPRSRSLTDRSAARASGTATKQRIISANGKKWPS